MLLKKNNENVENAPKHPKSSIVTSAIIEKNGNEAHYGGDIMSVTASARLLQAPAHAMLSNGSSVVLTIVV